MNLRVLVVFGFCFLTLTAWTQKPPVSQKYDDEIRQIIRNVESEDGEKTLINNLEPKSDLERQVSKRSTEYFRAMLDEDWDTAYKMMSNQYRKVITENKYSGKKRLEVGKAKVTRILLNGDSCAMVYAYIWGQESSSNLGQLKIPMKVIFFQEDGEWRIYENPYENSMGIMLPRARKMKKPCNFDNINPKG